MDKLVSVVKDLTFVSLKRDLIFMSFTLLVTVNVVVVPNNNQQRWIEVMAYFCKVVKMLEGNSDVF